MWQWSYLIWWSPTQTIGLIIVESKNLNSSLDTEVMQNTSHLHRKQVILKDKNQSITSFWIKVFQKTSILIEHQSQSLLISFTEQTISCRNNHILNVILLKWDGTTVIRPIRVWTETFTGCKPLPLSCNAACDHLLCPHQTGSYTEAVRCHPAILRGTGKYNENKRVMH